MKVAYNFITKTNYSGSNAYLKGKSKYNAFATFKQISSAGYKINKGAKGEHIFCGFQPVDVVDENGKPKTKSVPKVAVVFDIADTTAMDDAKLIKSLDKIKPSQQEINQELLNLIWGQA